MAKIGIVAAVGENGVIGRAGKMPWHLPKDLARFKAITFGHPIIMGRRTFESIGRALPGRRSIVLSTVDVEDVESFRDLDSALAEVGDQRVFVIGGRRLFEEAEPLADELHLTRVHGNPDGDTFYYPDLSGWRVTERRQVSDSGYRCTFETYVR